jgi:hypothetical protein
MSNSLDPFSADGEHTERHKLGGIEGRERRSILGLLDTKIGCSYMLIIE